MFPGEGVRDRGVAPDLAAIAGMRAAREEALGAVDLADRVEHREGRLVRRALRHLGLRDARARVALEQPMREVPPPAALADQRDLGLGLDRHLLLDLRRDSDDGRSRELAERRPAVAEDPRVAVLVGADLPGQAEGGQRGLDGVLGARVAGVLEIVLDAVEHRLRLGVLDLEAGDDERSLSLAAQDERDRPLGRSEREARVVEDVVGIEENDRPRAPRARRRSSSASQRSRCSSGVIAIEVTTIETLLGGYAHSVVKRW